MEPSHYRSHTASHHTVTSRTYADTPAHNYYGRLAEKAAPAGTIHLNSYEAEPSTVHSSYQTHAHTDYPSVRYHPRRIVNEVVTVRQPPVVVQERVVVKEEPVRKVVDGRDMVKGVSRGEGERERVVRKMEDGGAAKEKGMVRGAVGAGARTAWKMLGGR